MGASAPCLPATTGRARHVYRRGAMVQAGAWTCHRQWLRYPRLVQDITGSTLPVAPAKERRFWYQYYFLTDRSSAGLRRNCREFVRYIWQIWSLHWAFNDARFERAQFHLIIPTSSA